MIKKVLGKGLTSLIPDSYINNQVIKNSSENRLKETIAPKGQVQGFELISISQIAPNPEQPRQDFSSEGIEELAQSIKEKGILQPIIVRRKPEGHGATALPYELVCGERRIKAALCAGLEKIPVIVKDIAQGELLEWALVENIQREDLNPLEEARAYERLIAERGLSQEEVAKKVGKDRTTISNSIRLLRLPEEVLGYVKTGELSSGHARALLGLFSRDHQIQLARRVVKERLSVRQTEDVVSRHLKKRRARPVRNLTPEIIDLETRLSRFFGAQVQVCASKNSKRGRIIIPYSSLDELDRILSTIGFNSS